MRKPSARAVLGRLAAAVALLSGLACSPTAAPVSRIEGRADPRTRSAVILVTLDGVRWQDVFDGADPSLADRFGVPHEERLPAAELLPNLHRLMTLEGAAVGSGEPPMEASGPNFVSLPGYMEMLTGRADTGCTTNDCARVPLPTVVDDVAELGGEAAVIASWPTFARAASSREGAVAVSAGRRAVDRRRAFEREPAVGALLEASAGAPSFPGHGDFRADRETARLALAYFEAHAPELLVVGLGEPDEYGHRGDYRGYLRSLRHADEVVGRFAAAAAAETARGRPTTLLVTTDHGRADSFAGHGAEHPESRRVWLVAAGAGIEARGRVASPRPRRLADVAPTIRALLGTNREDRRLAGEPLDELLSPRVRRAAGDRALASSSP